ncbi:MAG: hypothetical protein ABI647_11265 [Gemmatimonadota bacterium]
MRLSRSMLGIALIGGCRSDQPAQPAWRMTHLTTVSQQGIVGYRDPLGTISPDGRWLATSVQGELWRHPVGGGAAEHLTGPGPIIQQILWLPSGDAIVTSEADTVARWWVYEPGKERRPLWPLGTELSATDERRATRSVRPTGFRFVAWTPDGVEWRGFRQRGDSTEIWASPFDAARGAASVSVVAGKLSFPSFSPRRELVCLKEVAGVPYPAVPCLAPDSAKAPHRPAYGPLAFSLSGDTLYFASPNDKGSLDLWLYDRQTRAEARMTNTGRDTYAPSVAKDGRLLVKTQNYRTSVWVMDLATQAARSLTAFQAETPSWDPTGHSIGVTYGTWRRYIDDYNYPDIAQDVGLISADSSAPQGKPYRVIEASPSEDQSMAWSPNGKWIVFHSHKDNSDDLWLMPADGSAPARRITFFGRGAEAGWPRWSPDGRWIVVGADSKKHEGSAIHRVAVDQQTGATKPSEEITIDGFEPLHAEWLPDSRRLAVHGHLDRDRQIIAIVSLGGGAGRVVHEFRNVQRFTGIGVSPDGQWVAFAAPDSKRIPQIFRVGIAGGTPEQLTADSSNKTQPAFSPDGKRLAYTVWEYSVPLWLVSR